MALSVKEFNMNHILTSPNSERAKNSSITEVFLSCKNSSDIVLPMLSYLSKNNCDKWLTWISSSSFNSTKLKSYAFNQSGTRLVRTATDDESLWIFWEALKIGNSHTVVADLSFLSERSRFELEQAAAIGNTQGIVLIQK